MLDNTGPRLPAPSISASSLVVPSNLLACTVAGLRVRSEGWRESACIWGGTREGRVTNVAFHHELGDDRATALSLELPEDAKFALYKQLAARQEVLLAMLHTHPEDWVGLSWIDAQNQLCSRIGFWSIVLPFYGAKEWKEAEIGFHIRCDRGWQQIQGETLRKLFRIEVVQK